MDDGTAPQTGRRHLYCPSCKERLSVPASTPAGTRARCGACGHLFRLAQGLPRAAAPADDDSIRSTRSGRPERRRPDLEQRQHPVRRSGVMTVDLDALLARMRRD